MTVERAFGVSLEDRGIPRRMIIVSLLLHILVLSLFLIVPKASSPKLTFGPDYAVNLVSTADLRMESGSRSGGLSKELADLPTLSEKVIRREADPLSSMPVRKVEAVKRPDAAVGKAVDEIRRRMADSPQKQTSSSAYSSREKTSETPAGGGGPSGTVSDAELSARMKTYYGSIWTRIKRRWSMPPDMLPRENIEVVIHVRILRSGAVEGISFEKRSGNNYFDESAMRAVRKASPFPPLPDGVGDDGIEMGIRFHSSELR